MTKDIVAIGDPGTLWLAVRNSEHDGHVIVEVGDSVARLRLEQMETVGRAPGFALRAHLDRDEATRVRDAITAWLDAPRDAARAAAELVERDDELLLVKTSLGEWGVGSEDEPPQAVTWFAGETAEQDARRLFAKERGKALCDNCPAEVDEGELTEAGEDGPDVCPACATALQEEFAATRYRCVGERTADQPGCGWTGTGAEVTVADGETFCPLCVDASEAEEVEDEHPTAEAPAGG